MYTYINIYHDINIQLDVIYTEQKMQNITVQHLSISHSGNKILFIESTKLHMGYLVWIVRGGGQNKYILPIISSDIWSVKSTWQNLPWNRYPTNKQSPIEHTCTIDLKQVKSEWSIVFQLASQHDILQLVSFNKSCQYWD